MKWIGLTLLSGVMGIFLAVMAEMAFPSLTLYGFTAAAVAASVLIFAILMHLTLTAGPIEVPRPHDWDWQRRMTKG